MELVLWGGESDRSGSVLAKAGRHEEFPAPGAAHGARADNQPQGRQHDHQGAAKEGEGPSSVESRKVARA